LNAIVQVFADTARQLARAADKDVASGSTSGPFHSFPMTVNHAWELAGAPSTRGTIGCSNYIPAHDGTVIALMRAAGAIPIGMTNVETATGT
jgi:amidase